MTRFAHRRPAPRSTRSGIRAGLASALLTLLLLAGNASCALGDADPASDVLLAQNAFFPYQPPVEPRLEGAMNSALEATARAGLLLKVAIIGSSEDLGAVPEFFGHPQPYANFLDREITFNHPQPLLVVMPAGYGLGAVGPASALAGLPVDASHSTYGLTRSAILAVVALARAAGHPIAAPAIPPSSTTHGGFPVALLFGIPALVLIGAGIALMRSGKPHDRPTPPPIFGPRA